MVLVQVPYAGVSILFKLIANDGMSLRVLMAYRYLFTSVFMIPLAYFGIHTTKFIRGSNFFGKCNICYGNIQPHSWFILALCFGLERLNIGTSAGKAKVVGTVMGIGGAMMLSFYKNIEIHIWSTHVNLMPNIIKPHNVSPTKISGSFIAFGTCLSYSVWLAKMSAKFPWHYKSAALMSVMACIQSITYALLMETNHRNRWRLGWNIRLLTALIDTLIVLGCCAFWILLGSDCVVRALYTAAFNPLFLILVTIAGSLLLDERLYLGRFKSNIHLFVMRY
ncbi:WAT1-related protein [Glycine soja]